ncbi:MAG: bifunctional riboflavin kinase/FAD synthetase [Mariprofundales bacterium]
MHIIRSWTQLAQLPDLSDLQQCALTVGNFDGVHMGHQQILAELRGHALAIGGASVVVTFEPHPRAILYPAEAPRRLCHLHERLALLEEAGIDAVLLLRFNKELAAVSSTDFINNLYKYLNFRHMHIGYDFAFGHNREGGGSQLHQLADAMNFTISEAAAFIMRDAVVSSSRIRSAIEAADFNLANTLLGRNYSISGHVGKGDARGRELGFPTANLNIGNLSHPPAGIYAAWAQQGQKIWPAAAYLGYRPTFDGRSLLLETHILNDKPDLYHQRLMVSFVQRVREDRAFANVKALIRQIAKDCVIARTILNEDAQNNPRGMKNAD